MSAAIKHRRRTCQFDCELGKGNIRPNTTYPNSKERKSHPQRTNPNSRTSHRAERRPTTDRRTVVCMHARALCAATAAVHGRRGMKRGAAEKMRVPRRAWSRKKLHAQITMISQKKGGWETPMPIPQEPRKVDGQMLLSSTGLRRHQPQLFLVWKSKFG